MAPASYWIGYALGYTFVTTLFFVILYFVVRAAIVSAIERSQRPPAPPQSAEDWPDSDDPRDKFRLRG